jgi:hypothetical protein
LSARGIGVPVDLDRLKAEFPDLTDDDLAAYVAVTRRVLADPAGRGRAVREVLERARAAPPPMPSANSPPRWATSIPPPARRVGSRKRAEVSSP